MKQRSGWLAVVDHPRTVVFAGLLLHLQLGVPYSYSLLRPSLQKEFNLSAVTAALPYSVVLVCYTLGMLLGGPLSDRFGPRGVGLVGVAAFTGGFATAGHAPSLLAFIALYGVLCGTGIGLAYMAAVAAAVRQYPHHRGAATGVVALGFGLSSALLAPALSAMVASEGWRLAMVQLGIGFALGSVPLIAFLRYPSGPGETAPADRAPRLQGEARRQFGWLWCGWATALTVGLGWIVHLPELARAREFTPAQVAGLVMTLGLANGLGRPLVGWLGDRFGRLNVLIGAGLNGMAWLGLATVLQAPAGFIAVAAGIGLGFGAWMVNMAPTAAECFGEASVGQRYGALFTSFGVGAVVGPLALGALRTISPSDQFGLFASVITLLVSAGCFAQARRGQRRACG